MKILLDTGVLDTPTQLGNTVEAAEVLHILSEPKIYPTDGDAIVAIGQDQMVVVSAYWAEEGDPTLQMVEVFKVLTTSGVPASGESSCCPSIHSIASVVARSTKLCGWELRDCNPVMVINTPGKYQFIPNSAAEGVILTAQILPLQEFNNGLDNSIRP